MLGLNFFRPKEKFLLLEIAPKRTTGLLLSLDRDKKLTPEKFWDEFYFHELSGDPLKNLRKRKLIVAAHPSFVTEVSFPVALRRESADHSSPLTVVELENLFSKMIGKVFNQHRGEASKQLGLHDFDTVLVGARAGNFKIDGHMVLNPLGFRGRIVEAVLELTFTTRQIFEDLKEFFNTREGFFFTGLAHSGIFTISRVQDMPVNLILIGDEQAPAFILDKAAWGNVTRREVLNWPLVSLFDAIAAALHASPDVVLELYYRYIRRDMSDNLYRSMGRIMKPEVDKLLKEVKGVNFRGRVYLHSPVRLPMELPAHHGRIVLDELPLGRVLDRFGFKLDLSEWPSGGEEVFMKLAPFFEFYFDKSDSEINRRLRRRLHWLIQ